MLQPSAQFLKVGKVLINLAQIVDVDLSVKCVTIAVAVTESLDGEEHFARHWTFTGDEAEAIRGFFRCMIVNPVPIAEHLPIVLDLVKDILPAPVATEDSPL